MACLFDWTGDTWFNYLLLNIKSDSYFFQRALCFLILSELFSKLFHAQTIPFLIIYCLCFCFVYCNSQVNNVFLKVGLLNFLNLQKILFVDWTNSVQLSSISSVDCKQKTLLNLTFPELSETNIQYMSLTAPLLYYNVEAE